MSAIKLKTEKQLEKFLKILAEESVLAAQASPEQSRQKAIAKQIKHDKASLSEEDPEKAAPSTTQEEPPAEKAPAEPPPEPEAKPAPATSEAEDLNPTLDSLIRAINELRSGFGTNDSPIENELSLYFDRLDNAERVSLIVMLRSLGDIMRKEADGSTAREPSQYNVIMSMKAKEASSSPAAPASSSDTQKTPDQEPEDTAPPIKVGEPVSEAYRARIRSLLKRSN